MDVGLKVNKVLTANYWQT